MNTYRTEMLARKRAEREAREIAAQVAESDSVPTLTAEMVESAAANFDRVALVKLEQECAAALRRVAGTTASAGDIAHDVYADIVTGRHKDGASTLALFMAGSSVGMQRMRRLIRQATIDTARREGMYSQSAELVRFANADSADLTTPKTHRQRNTVEDGPRRVSHGPLAHRDMVEREAVAAAIAASLDYSTLGTLPDADGNHRTIPQGIGGDRADIDNAARFIRSASDDRIRNVREANNVGTGQFPAWNAGPFDRKQAIATGGGREKMVRGIIRMVTNRPLEDLLTEELRTHHVRDHADRTFTLTTSLGRREVYKRDVARFGQTFPSILNATATGWTGTGATNLVPAIARLSERTAEWWELAAIRYRDDYRAAESEASDALSAAKNLPSTATKEQKKNATGTASAAVKRAGRAENLAQLAFSLANLARSGQSVRFSDMVTSAIVTEHADTAKAKATERSAYSAIDRASMLAILGLPVDANGRASRGMVEILQTAADAAVNLPEVNGQAPGEWEYNRQVARVGRDRGEWLNHSGYTVRTFGRLNVSGPVDRFPAPRVVPKPTETFVRWAAAERAEWDAWQAGRTFHAAQAARF